MIHGVNFEASGMLAFVNSPTAWVMVAGALLLLFGGKNIPELMKGLGQGMREFKKGMEQDADEAIVPVSASGRDSQYEADIEAEVRRRVEAERHKA